MRRRRALLPAVRGVSLFATVPRMSDKIDELTRELEAARALAAEHFTARTDAERTAADAQRRGVLIAIRWIRGMPRRSIAGRRINVGVEIYQLVAMSIARYLEERLDVCDEVTSPALPPNSERG